MSLLGYRTCRVRRGSWVSAQHDVLGYRHLGILTSQTHSGVTSGSQVARSQLNGVMSTPPVSSHSCCALRNFRRCLRQQRLPLAPASAGRRTSPTPARATPASAPTLARRTLRRVAATATRCTTASKDSPSILASCSFVAHGGTICGPRHDAVDGSERTPLPDNPHRSDVRLFDWGVPRLGRVHPRLGGGVRGP